MATINDVTIKSFSATIIIDGTEYKHNNKEEFYKLLSFYNNFQRERKEEHIEALRTNVLMLEKSPSGGIPEWVTELQKHYVVTQDIDNEIAGEKRKLEWKVVKNDGKPFNKTDIELFSDRINALEVVPSYPIREWNEDETFQYTLGFVVRKTWTRAKG